MRDFPQHNPELYIQVDVDEPLPFGVLLYDPITRLISYPCFADYLVGQFPNLAKTGIHLAIGDVDDLKRYVTLSNATNPKLFGHLAGNDCMRKVGLVTLEWARKISSGEDFHICGTFGGDEIIIAAAGLPYNKFLSSIQELAFNLLQSTPRPCSFASGTSIPMDLPTAESQSAFHNLVSSVDRALFNFKEDRNKQSKSTRGDVIDIGKINLNLNSFTTYYNNGKLKAL